MDVPFSYTKQVASDFGGTRNGMIIQWPAGIKAKGELRSQFGHVIDIAPTVYEITRIPAPKMVNGIKQDPIEGTSLAYTFNDAGTDEKHKVQYFEMFGNGECTRMAGLPGQYIGRHGYRNLSIRYKKISGSYTIPKKISVWLMIWLHKIQIS